MFQRPPFAARAHLLLLTLLLMAMPLVSWGAAGEGCSPNVNRLAQSKDFYEGLAVLAKNNHEKFFLPKFRRQGHASLYLQVSSSVVHGSREDQSPSELRAAVVPHWTQSQPEPLKIPEMAQLRDLRELGPKHQSTFELQLQAQLERKLHRYLFYEHHKDLENYQAWAFDEFPPMRAYQRIFENFVSSSVWWNNYVYEYAVVMANLLAETAERADCHGTQHGVFWSSLGGE